MRIVANVTRNVRLEKNSTHVGKNNTGKIWAIKFGYPRDCSYIHGIIEIKVMALRRNNVGEYNYHFNFIDETGSTIGFNDVWASSKKIAVARAKVMEDSPGWRWYNGKTYVSVANEVTTGGHCYYNKGMFIDFKSMYKATQADADQMAQIGWALTN